MKINLFFIKSLKSIAIQFVILSLLVLSQVSFSKEILNIYNWTEYLPASVMQKFEKQTGIEVNYSTYSSNPELYAKLKASPNAGYDIIFPSSTFVERMVKDDMLLPLNKTKIVGLENINPLLLHREYDPENTYAIPYLWGTTGMVINQKFYAAENIQSWQDLWAPRFKDQILLINSPDDVFSIALHLLHFPTNTHNPNDIKLAYEKLLTLLPNVKLFKTETTQSVYINGDASIGMSYSGDAYIANQMNPNLRYIYPKDGAYLWIDNLVLPKGAIHINNAYRFINFILQPKIAAEIATAVGYSTPNNQALPYLSQKMRESRILYPKPEDLQNSFMARGMSNTINRLTLSYWQKLKLQAQYTQSE